MRKWIFALTLSTLTLTGCSEETIEGAEKISEQTLPDDASAYASLMQEHTTTLTALLEDFTEQINKSSEDPQVMLNEQWRNDTVAVLNQLSKTVDDIQSVSPPDSMGAAHKYTMMAMEEFEFVIENYPIAVDKLDGDLMTQCGEAMTSGGVYMGQAAESTRS